MNAEPIDDDPGPGRAPGQRASARRGTGTRRTAAAAESSTPASELPPVPASPVPAPADPPTTELRPTDLRPTDLRPGQLATELPGALPRVAPRAEPAAPLVAGPLPTNIYRARRPGVAILLIIPAVAVGVLFVRALAMAAFGETFDLARVIASVCALASLPFLVAGMYGLVSGAAHGAEHYGFKVWARPPLAYLMVGLAFVVAAALAAT